MFVNSIGPVNAINMVSITDYDVCVLIIIINCSETGFTGVNQVP